MQEITYGLLYDVYVLIFGVYVSLRIACGRLDARGWKIMTAACPLLLALQGIVLSFVGSDVVRVLYPVLAHLPVLLMLHLLMKIRWNASMVAVAISYSMCQLLRWVGLLVDAVADRSAGAALVHIALCQLLLLLLNRYCLDPIHDVIANTSHVISEFGIMPLAYYIYEYVIMYVGKRYLDVLVLSELLPTMLVLFFIIFVLAFRREAEKRRRAEYQALATELRLDQAENEIALLRNVQEQTALYRHDLRHHLRMIGGLLDAEKQEQALEYIREAECEIERITPVRYCENDTVNLLLGAFSGKAEREGITFSVNASLPPKLSIPDTELCVMLSNGLENALHAAAGLPDGQNGWIDVFCGMRQGNLLMEIKNACAGAVELRDGLPFTEENAHGYGCRSIQSIVQKRRGVCVFEAGKDMLTLRIAIPGERTAAGRKGRVE